ncbi:uncharacterized protein C22orf15 homolog [Podargus strigoides]
MFATVRYGANCQEMVNLQCSVLIFTAHLKRKCQCRPEECIDLLDETGALMNLSKVENPASEFTSKYLQEREHYILIRVVEGESTEATCYESLLDNLEKHYPDIAGKRQASTSPLQRSWGCWHDSPPQSSHAMYQLQQISTDTQMRDLWRTGTLQKKAQPLTSTPAKLRTTSQRKKNSKLKSTPK